MMYVTLRMLKEDSDYLIMRIQGRTEGGKAVVRELVNVYFRSQFGPGQIGNFEGDCFEILVSPRDLFKVGPDQAGKPYALIKDKADFSGLGDPVLDPDLSGDPDSPGFSGPLVETPVEKNETPGNAPGSVQAGQTAESLPRTSPATPDDAQGKEK